MRKCTNTCTLVHAHFSLPPTTDPIAQHEVPRHTPRRAWCIHRRRGGQCRRHQDSASGLTLDRLATGRHPGWTRGPKADDQRRTDEAVSTVRVQHRSNRHTRGHLALHLCTSYRCSSQAYLVFAITVSYSQLILFFSNCILYPRSCVAKQFSAARRPLRPNDFGVRARIFRSDSTPVPRLPSRTGLTAGSLPTAVQAVSVVSRVLFSQRPQTVRPVHRKDCPADLSCAGPRPFQTCCELSRPLIPLLVLHG